MFTNSRAIARISQELLDELTEGGTRDLTGLRLDQLEQEVYEAVDRVTQRVLQGVLEDQAGQAQVDCCPRCRGKLEDRPPDQEPLQLDRCTVQWDKPVKHCRKCRRDFFPSGEDAGLHGGGDL